MKRATLLLSAFLCLTCARVSRAGESRVPSTLPPPPPPRKATAAQLVADAKRALALIGKTTKESKDASLDFKNVRQQPFWSALKHTNESILSIEAQLKTHDLAFFEALNTSTQCAAELRGALPRSGIKNAAIESGVKALCAALILLRKNYGVEAVRKRQGGALSDAEQAEFAKLREAQKTLVAQLERLQSEIKTNAHLNAEVGRLIAQLKKSIAAPMTVETMGAALELVDIVDGEWDSYSFYVDPKNRKAWNNARIGDSMKAVDSITADSLKDLAVPDWSFLDESVDVSAAADIDVAMEVNEVDGYVSYIAQSANGLELEIYYEEVSTDDMADIVIDEPADE